MRQTGKYRARTWLRGVLPYVLADFVPKGAHDCGAHEWYREDDHTALCYHCEVGERRLAPGQKVADPPSSEPSPVVRSRGQVRV